MKITKLFQKAAPLLVTGIVIISLTGKALANHHDMTVIVKIPYGGGTVTSSPAGINCPSDCQQTYNWNTGVQLIPTPAAGRTFIGWTGICYSPNCSFYLTDASATTTTRTASFGYQKHTLQVAKSGTGSGTVSGAGISCGGTCSTEVANGAKVAI